MSLFWGILTFIVIGMLVGLGYMIVLSKLGEEEDDVQDSDGSEGW